MIDTIFDYGATRLNYFNNVCSNSLFYVKNNRTFRSPYSIPTGPSDSDILAKITLPSLDYSKFGKFIPDNGGSLQLNSRAYFGPVDLDRFTIKLIDNNGNLVNLNNRDWSFTLRVEQLYQY